MEGSAITQSQEFVENSTGKFIYPKLVNFESYGIQLNYRSGRGTKLERTPSLFLFQFAISGGLPGNCKKQPKVNTKGDERDKGEEKKRNQKYYQSLN